MWARPDHYILQPNGDADSNCYDPLRTIVVPPKYVVLTFLFIPYLTSSYLIFLVQQLKHTVFSLFSLREPEVKKLSPELYRPMARKGFPITPKQSSTPDSASLHQVRLKLLNKEIMKNFLIYQMGCRCGWMVFSILHCHCAWLCACFSNSSYHPTICFLFELHIFYNLHAADWQQGAGTTFIFWSSFDKFIIPLKLRFLPFSFLFLFWRKGVWWNAIGS